MARLPNPGGDDGSWGDILNDFLKQSHKDNGKLKPVQTDDLADSAVTTKKLGLDVRHMTTKEIMGPRHRLTAEDMDMAILEVNSTKPVTIIVPKDDAIKDGAIVEFCQVGKGQIIFVAESKAVVLRSSASVKSRTQWSGVTLRYRRANEWVLGGDLE